jgi:hypothetical protein
MKRRIALLVAMALCAVLPAYALYSVSAKGDWPKTWPVELEPLREHSQTYVGPMIASQHHVIPFTKREEFEAAWPHLLKVKTQGAPIFLVRSPYKWLGEMDAGVLVHTPPLNTDRRVFPEAPMAGVVEPHMRWTNTNYIELVVDGNIVDLNRIPLPADTPIIDERFKVAENK